jgi:hypothetical protein
MAAGVTIDAGRRAAVVPAGLGPRRGAWPSTRSTFPGSMDRLDASDWGLVAEVVGLQADDS